MNLDLSIEQANPVQSLRAFPVTTPAREDCEDASGAVAGHYTVQCFICSRIYFDQEFLRCPRCRSDSLQHYRTADLNYFARDRIGESFEARAVIHSEQ
ncbi:MAG: hypothetical protein WB630_08135 [Candidatus Acidiferrales bacterium]